ncbi:MAG: glycosyltransferase family 39 protein [Solirubrobacteraceae bacterium]
MASEVTAPRVRARATPLARLAELGWPAPAWGAIGVTTLFIGITIWWLTQDRSIPIFDAGLHLNLALNVQKELAAGNLGTALTLSVPYPPFAYLVGSLGIAIGGVGVAPPIIAENLVFVTLLALGCYKVGRLAFSPLAGLLAVVFALGSPLIAAQFHVFMTDAPETAMVAVSVWLVIASEGFTKLRTCALAGVAVGLGMLTKEPFPIFVLGVGLVTLWRGGRGAWPGVAVLAAIALALALPWYIHEHALIQGIGDQATASSSAYQSEAGPAPKDIAPPRLSSANLEWYLWNLDNVELGLPLLLLAAAGFVWTVAGFVPKRARSSAPEEVSPGPRSAREGSASKQGRGGKGGQAKAKRPPTRESGWKPRAASRAATAAQVTRARAPVSPLALELTVGASVAWLILTETFFHDTRYSMPLLLYPAVFAGGWIAHFSGRRRAVAVGVLALVVVANMMGSTFGVGSQYRITLPGASPTALQQPGYLTLYPGGFLVSGPHRDGDLLGTLQALRRYGVRDVSWNQRQGAIEPYFSNGGVAVLAQIAGLKEPASGTPPAVGRRIAELAHGKIVPGEVPPCLTLDDGTGVWIRVGNPTAPGAQDFCPLPRPHHYGPKQA